MQQSTLTGKQLQWRNTQWFLSQWEGSGSALPKLRSETQLRNRSLNLYYNNQGVDLTCDSKMTTKEKRGGPTQYIVQVLVKISVMSPI